MPTVSTQTNVSQPWSGAVPFIKKGMTTAQQYLNHNVGFKPPSFDTYVPFSDQTTQSLAQIQGLAGQGNPLAGQSVGAISGILSGDINNRYNQLYQQGAGDYAGLQGQMNQLYQQAGNPYFEQAVQTQADKTAADVQRQFGGLGRIGSAADTGALAQQVGDVRTQALANNWNQNIANQRGILGDLSGLYSNYTSNQGNLLSGQTAGQLNAVAAAPGAYQQQYLPAERLGQVGAANEDLSTRALQARMDRYNAWQQAPWSRLNAYNSAITGSGGNAPGLASTTATVKQPTNWLGMLAGGTLAGASLLSGTGYGTGGQQSLLQYLMGNSGGG